jgi:hypothetical protein
MSGMDSGLNKNAGIFIRNFYQPFVRAGSTDEHYLMVGRITTAILGAGVIFVALRLAELQHLNLFVQMQRVSILVTVPVAVPLLLGLILKHTPPWSAWSTVLVGFFCSLFIGDLLTPAWAARTFGLTLDAASREYWIQGIQFFGNVLIGSAWFCGTALFWKHTSTQDRAAIAEFTRRLNTPVDFNREEGATNANDRAQQSTVGWLALAYGAFVLALALIPNTFTGRLAFAGCGGSVALIGILLLWAARKHPPRPDEPPPQARTPAAEPRLASVSGRTDDR